jgi:Tol biopolymer transport system component
MDGASWPAVSPDGSSIAYLGATTHFKDIALNKEIWLARSDGSEARKLVGSGEDVFGPPAWAPDGKHIAYMRGQFAAGMPWIRSRLEIYDLSTGEMHVVIASPALGATIAWSSDGRLIFSLAEPLPNQNDANLWAVKVDGNGRAQGNATRLTSGPGEASLISVTNDGKRVAYFRRTVEPDVYIGDLDWRRGTLSSLRRLTLDERADFPYSWTPDSKSVIFVSNRNGPYNIFRMDIQGGEPELLVRAPEDMISPRLSPDGKSLFYLITPRAVEGHTAQNRLMRVPVEGGPSQTILESPGISNQQCARLPSTVCVLSRYEPGKERFFYYDPEKGLGEEISKAEINPANAFDFNWSLSPDGTTIVMAREEGSKRVPEIRLFTLASGAERMIPVPGWAGIGSLDWASDSRSVWATGYNSDSSKTLLNIAVSGKVRPFYAEQGMTLGWSIPSPDGKHLALWRAHGDSNVWMLENF